MENEEKVEESNQEKVSIPYECPPIPQINMDNPTDKAYQLVLLKVGLDSFGSCPIDFNMLG